jgi:hypothetical protein
MSNRVGLLALIATVHLLAPAPASGQSEAKLTDPLGTADDHLGMVVALSGNYAIVGAPGNDSAAEGAGKAVIFHFNGLQWVVQEELFPHIGPLGASFGASVGISGDYAIVGAPGSVSDHGRAYIYHRVETSWDFEKNLEHVDLVQGDRFGHSVGITSTHAAAGAPGVENHLQVQQGATYIFERSGSSWAYQTVVRQTTFNQTNFGSALSLVGDRLLVGASEQRIDFETRGAAHLYQRAESSWTLAHTFTEHNGSINSSFGLDVSLDGDRVLVGKGTSVAYLFEEPTPGNWWATGFPIFSGGFGGIRSVAVSGDILAFGKPFAGPGLVDVSKRIFSSWTPLTAFGASDGSGRFGNSLSYSGFCLIVGAPEDGDVAAEAGAAYVYCDFPSPPFLVDLHIICCENLPPIPIDPVHIEIRFSNLTPESQALQRSVHLMEPDGTVREIVPSQDFVVDGELVEEHMFSLEEPAAGGALQAATAGPAPGTYLVTVRYEDENGMHEISTSINVSPPAVPALQPWGLALLLLLMQGLGSGLLQRRGRRAGRARA